MCNGSCYEPDAKTYGRLRKALGADGTTHVIRDSAAAPVIMALVVALSIALYFVRLNGAPRSGNLLLATVLLLVNVAIHEIGHAAVLKIHLPQARARLGFRLTFVFPTVYVNTSESYLLPRGKRASVHLAGVFANAVYLILVALFAPSLLWPSYTVVGTMLLNLIPVMRGDGYHVVETLSGRRRLAPSGRAQTLEDCARGAIMLVVVCLLERLVPTPL